MYVKTMARNILEIITTWKLNVIVYKLCDPGKVRALKEVRKCLYF